MKRTTLLAATLLVACNGSGDDGDDDTTTPNVWTEAFDAEDDGWLLSVWGLAPNDLWIAGGQPDAGRLLRYDGTAATPAELPAETPLLNWSYGFAADDVFVVGNEGTILHWDGSAFTVESSSTTQNLWGVWGASSDDVWAVGGNGRQEGDLTLLRRQNGVWSHVALPELERPRVNALFKVWGTSANNVYAVGQRGTVVHFDGTEWTEELVGTSEDLIALWGTGADRIAIVGGRNNGQIVTWDGSNWNYQSLAPLPGLNGVWMRDPDVIHVVGVSGTLAKVDFASLEYTEDGLSGEARDFHAVYGHSEGLTTVGGNFLQVQGPYRGIVYERGLAADE